MAKKKEKGESAAVIAFKKKYDNAKKPFPSEEQAALDRAHERNHNEPVKAKAKAPVKHVEAAEIIDKEREKIVANNEKVIEAAKVMIKKKFSK